MDGIQLMSNIVRSMMAIHYKAYYKMTCANCVQRGRCLVLGFMQVGQYNHDYWKSNCVSMDIDIVVKTNVYHHV